MQPEIYSIISELSKQTADGYVPLESIISSAQKHKLIGIAHWERIRVGKIVKELQKEGKLIQSEKVFQSFKPTSEAEPLQITEKEVEYDTEKIIYALKSFFIEHGVYPTPIQIADKFIAIYGKANIESITRFVRLLYEKGRLKRTEENKYFVENMNLEDSLNKFV